MPDIKLGHQMLQEMIKKMNDSEDAAIEFYNSLDEYRRESLKMAIKETVENLTAMFDGMSAELRKISERIELLGDAFFQIEQSEDDMVD